MTTTDLVAALRPLIERAAARYYYAAGQEAEAHRAGDLMLRSYWRGVKVQVASDTEPLCELVGDASPEWDAMDRMAVPA